MQAVLHCLFPCEPPRPKNPGGGGEKTGRGGIGGAIPAKGCPSPQMYSHTYGASGAGDAGDGGGCSGGAGDGGGEGGGCDGEADGGRGNGGFSGRGGGFEGGGGDGGGGVGGGGDGVGGAGGGDGDSEPQTVSNRGKQREFDSTHNL